MTKKLIHTVEELKEICLTQNGEYVDFFIALAGGTMRSSKQISYNSSNNTFSVINEIDNSYQDDLTEDELGSETNIIFAIEKKALYQYL